MTDCFQVHTDNNVGVAAGHGYLGLPGWVKGTARYGDAIFRHAFTFRSSEKGRKHTSFRSFSSASFWMSASRSAGMPCVGPYECADGVLQASVAAWIARAGGGQKTTP